MVDMEIKPLVRDELVLENGAYGQRLVPWPALNAPFEGAWVVVPAGGATGAHAHHEYEIFVAISGEATLEIGRERRAFRAGDVEYHSPGTEHRVVNSSETEPFEMYAVWWDREMADRFVDRHEGTA
jgi:mannose-6-phosphate isomerase-like protein (cupin superfamily)